MWLSHLLLELFAAVVTALGKMMEKEDECWPDMACPSALKR
ncbi:uncharacterized protein Asalp_22290 [Aeromonas salmonicida subsp. pectinolytica 34mel]|uniref:Uncharacterized protein n=1 Tax=Aeromonas salmonicida subsp. pectinolytica 34mel TaxID=1324960 RepID=A0A2D1QG52_AERSA|nr:uncharacterized protein Asalp_22290 [Aeromonas salmonicida subsp. pectinolytica 34mel]